MNRLIIIGNGFDLAHNLKTSYHDFIDDFWADSIEELKKIVPYQGFSNDFFDINYVPSVWSANNTFEDLISSINGTTRSTIIFKNKFLEHISKKKGIQNWVDIENEYYELLKDSFKISSTDDDYDIFKLNKEFKEVALLLEKYLIKIENQFMNAILDQKLKSEIGYKIYEGFHIKDFTEIAINEKVEFEYDKIKADIQGLKDGNIVIQEIEVNKERLISRIGSNDPKKEIRKLLLNDGALNYFDLKPKSILFLNFNYTSTEKHYLRHQEFDAFLDYKNLDKEVIHIHGVLNDKSNPMIFGFGDELDSHYQEIENLNDNEYLENIKSIKYLETDNYKKVLEFVNSSSYQIFVFGHSCGLSDRTLLSTLFGHNNCHSIKLFYHQKDTIKDNYSDIIRNISRNFSDKTLMRDKVVNKTYSLPLKEIN